MARCHTPSRMWAKYCLLLLVPRDFSRTDLTLRADAGTAYPSSPPSPFSTRTIDDGYLHKYADSYDLRPTGYRKYGRSRRSATCAKTFPPIRFKCSKQLPTPTPASQCTCVWGKRNVKRPGENGTGRSDRRETGKLGCSSLLKERR